MALKLKSLNPATVLDKTAKTVEKTQTETKTAKPSKTKPSRPSKPVAATSAKPSKTKPSRPSKEVKGGELSQFAVSMVETAAAKMAKASQKTLPRAMQTAFNVAEATTASIKLLKDKAAGIGAKADALVAKGQKKPTLKASVKDQVTALINKTFGGTTKPTAKETKPTTKTTKTAKAPEKTKPTGKKLGLSKTK
jgi:hypothetical protein